MLGERNTPEELITAFHHDSEWWKSAIGYLENEIQFINRLLHAHVYKEGTSNLFERLQQFKHEMAAKTRETANLKKEILEYEDKLRGILECQDLSCDAYYIESHKALKERYEVFYTGFNNYKAKVFDYLGGIFLMK